MKNIIGSPARGKDFYQRKREVEKIISSLEQYQFTSPVVKRWWIKFIC